MIRIFLVSLGLLALGVACEQDEPCERYIDYMCDCHPDDVDCAELEETLSGADADVQDECSLDLGDQQDEDESEGAECGDETGA